MVVSAATAKQGEPVVAVLEIEGDLGGIQGTLTFDPADWTYAGQPLTGRTLVMVNSDSAERGHLRWLAYRHEGLESRAAVFQFVALRSGARADFAIHAGEAVKRATPALVASPQVEGSRVDPGLRPLTGVRRLGIDDWVRHLGLSEATKVARVAGDGRTYGDASLNGVVTALDAALTSRVAVGLDPLLANPANDIAIAANVAPFNLPLLGEADDPVPPGRNADGTFTITVLDVSAISSEAVQRDQPVVGEIIPGRTPTFNRQLLAGTIDSGVIRALSADTVYELQGTVVVRKHGRLLIPAGTRIEGDQATAGELVVERGGVLSATGTRLEPVVFTCDAESKTRGCWGGIQLLGYGPLNNGSTVGGSGNEVTGCPERIGPSGAVYGGCLPNEGGSTLRFVRVEYAGGGAGQEAAGLALLGVGTGTTVDSVQVYGSAADGLYVSGGFALVRHVVLSNHLGTALRWDHGWQGQGQFIIIQVGPGNGDAMRGSNFGPQPNTTPISNPTLYNVLISGPAMPGSGSAAGIVLENGSGLTIRNSIVYGVGGPGLNVEGQATCDRVAAGSLLLSNSIFFALEAPGSTDSDCVDEGAYLSDPLLANRFVDPQLIAPTSTAAPDFRPRFGSPAGAGGAIPPDNAFLNPLATYLGGVEPASAVGNVVPWYPGWTRGWNGTP
jgi:hypothetical protein